MGEDPDSSHKKIQSTSKIRLDVRVQSNGFQHYTKPEQVLLSFMLPGEGPNAFLLKLILYMAHACLKLSLSQSQLITEPNAFVCSVQTVSLS